MPEVSYLTSSGIIENGERSDQLCGTLYEDLSCFEQVKDS